MVARRFGVALNHCRTLAQRVMVALAMLVVGAAAAQAQSQSLFTTQTPVLPNVTDGTPYEMGMKFRVASGGTITAIRYWKASSDTGTHTGHIWSSTGTLLATTTFSGGTASGWQQQALATPLTIQANTTYVVSVNVNAYYVFTGSGLAASVVNGAISSVADGQNGVYGTRNAFPRTSFQNSNYFRDVVFVPAGAGAPAKLALTPLAVSTQSGVAVGYAATVQDASGNKVTSATNPITFTASGVTGSFSPTSPVAAVSGVANSNFIPVTVGTATITVSATGLTGASTTLTVTPGVASRLSLTPATATVQAGSPVAYTARILDANGNTVTTATNPVTVALSGISGASSPASPITASAGVATFSVTPTSSGFGTVVVSTAGLTGASAALTVTPGAPSRITLAPATSNAQIGTPVGYTATIVDANGNTVTNAVNSITFSATGVSGSFSPASPVSPTGGLATSAFTASTAGSATITATAAGLTGASAALTVTAGAASKLVLVPSTASTQVNTAVPYTATIQDANGNTVSTATTPITFTVTGVSGTFNPASPITPTGGSATSALTPTTVGAATITVTAAGLTSATASLQVNAGAATKLVLVPATTSTQVNTAVPYTATIQDANGNTVSTATTPITFTVTGVSGTFNPVSPITPTGGSATSALTPTTTGAATITATAAGLTSATASLQVNAGAATKLVLVPTTTSTSVNTPVPYTATIQDASGNTVSTATTPITFTVTGVSGTFNPVSPITPTGGSATSTLTPTTAGAATITVTAAGLTSASASLNVNPGAAIKLALVPTTSTTQAGVAVGYTATIQDAAGNTVTTATNSITFSVSGASGSFNPASPITASGGVATTSLTPTTIGTATITATASGLSGASASLTVTPGIPAKLILTPSSATRQVGVAIAYTAIVQDANGNTVTDAVNTVTFSVAGVAGSFNPTSTVNPTGGAATASLTPTTAGTGTITVSSTGLTSAAASLTVTPAVGPPAKLALVPTNASGQTGVAIEYTVAIQDANGNAVTNATNPITFAVSGVAGSFAPASPVNALNGIATSSFTATSDGTATISVSSPGLAGASTSLTVTAVVGPPAKLALIPVSTTTVVGTAVNYTATIQDVNGITVTTASDTITFAVDGVTGTFAPDSQIPATSGLAVSSLTPTATGPATVTVSAPGLTSATATLNVIPAVGPPAKLVLAASVTTTQVGTDVVYTATIQDANGIVVGTATNPVAFSVSGVSGTFNPDAPVTPSNGTAVASLTATTSGAATITVSADGLTSASLALQVNPAVGPPAQVVLTQASTSTPVGVGVLFTATIQDAAGNTVTTATSPLTFAVSGVAGTFDQVSPVTPTNGVVATSLTPTTDGTATIVVSSPGLTGASTLLTVTPVIGPPAKIMLVGASGNTQVGSAVAYTATIQDANGNIITGATNPVTLSVSGVTGAFNPASPLTPANGVATSSFTASSTGAATITASAAGLTSAAASLQVDPGPAAKLVLVPTTTSTSVNTAVPYTATIQDANGNTVSTATTPITFTVTGVSGTFNPVSPITPTGGSATSALTPTTVGAATITVTAAGLTSATASLQVNAGAATKLVLVPATSSSQVNTAVPYTATIQDANGNTVSTATTPITFTVTGVSGTFNPVSPIAPTGGSATSALTPTTVGAATITVTAAGLTSATASLQVNAGAATKLVLVPATTSTQVNTAVPYTVTIQDANGNTVSTATTPITFTVTGVSGTFNPVSPITPTGGSATSALTPTTVGAATITVTAAGLTSATASLQVNAGAATKLVLVPATTSTQVNTAVPYTATIQDANGNTVSTATTPITFTVTGVSGTFNPVSPIIPTGGSSTSALTPTTVGAATITVTAAGLTSATASLQVNAGAATKLVLVPATSSSQVNTAVPYTATIQDANGNTVSTATTPITFAVTGVSGTFNPVSPITPTGGSATSALTPTTVGAATITATAAGLTSATASLQVNAGAATKLVLVPATQSTQVSTGVTYTATIQDANGNTVVNASNAITFAVSGVSGTFNPTSPVTSSGGSATSTLTPTTVGNATITVSSSGLTSATASLTVTAGAPAKLALTPLNRTTQVGAPVTYVATIQDAAGNTVTTATNPVMFTSSGLSGEGASPFVPPSPIIPVNGIATTSYSAPVVATLTITVSSGTLTPATATLVVTPGAPAKLSLQPASGTVQTGVARAYTATIQDASGNTVSTATNPITFAVSGVSGAFSPTNPVAPASGVATSSLTATTAGTATITASAAGLTSDSALLTVTAAQTSPPQSLFTTQTPTLPNASDGVPYELGMKFRVARVGKITAIRYWKSASDATTHVGRIWSATGTLLTSVTFTSETASGWQQQALPAPLSILANTTYVVSVNIATNYPFTGSGLATSIVNGDISSVADGRNGVYGSAFAFPTNSFQNSNYFRDIVFVPDAVNTITKASGDNQTGASGATLPTPLIVLVRDGGNNPLANVPVTFAVSSGTGSVAPTSTTTNAAGQASATLTLGANGLTSVTATATGIGSVTFSARVTNAIFLENQNAGTTAWQLDNPVTEAAPEIAGFATATSVNKGSSLPMKVTLAQAGQYRIDVYRLGYYGGTGGRLMGSFGPFAGVKQTPCGITDAATLLIECRWNTSFTLAVGSAWTSGLYVANLTAVANNKQSQIWFVVRDDSSHADLLFQSSFNTFVAYNNYGDTERHSVYEYNSTNGVRAYKVSLDRPFGEITDDQTNANSMTRYERNMARWLESQSYDVTYISTLDTHTTPSLLLQHKTWLSVGHDEYWTLEMRNNVEQARDAGINLGFFSANTAYWRVRFEPSTTGDPNRVLVCYKDPAAHDPVAPTYLWRGPENNRPENALLGVMYVGDDVYVNGYDYVVTNANDPYYRNTGLTNGTAVSTLVGYEWDAVVNNGFTPPGLVVLSSSPTNAQTIAPGLPPGQSASISNAVRYTAPSGAKVFSTGSIQFAWGLDADGVFATQADSRIRQFVINILADMGARPLTPDDGMIVP
jgi:hypothetical protein